MNQLTANENPLLRPLPIPMGLIELSQMLERRPSAGDWDPDLVEEEIERIFVCTSVALDIASRLIDLLRWSARAQDPRKLLNRRAVIELGDSELLPAVATRSFQRTTRAMVVIGPTGVGKSTILERVLELVPQLYVHSASAECEMLMLSQVVHLTVQLSADGSPAAFILEACTALDDILGTNYADEICTSRRSVQSQLKKLMQKLALHRVLVLVIEEVQRENVSHKAYSAEFRSFTFRLMHFGIPVVLVGNPLFVNELFPMSQSLRRLTSGGRFRVDPVLSPEDEEWVDDLVPGIWKSGGMPAQDAIWCTEAELNVFLWQKTGGSAGLLARLRSTTVSIAKSHGSPRVELSHIHEALASPEYEPMLAFVRPFVERDADLLEARFIDIDAPYYRRLWSARKAMPSTEAPPASAIPRSEATSSQLPQETTTKVSAKRAPASKPRGSAKKSQGSQPSGQEYSDDDTRSGAWLGKQPKGLA